MVVADGPRPEKGGEAARCDAARALVDDIDWNCEVLKNYSDENLGCRKRVATGLDWVFRTVPEAIILEDDCVPEASFFGYCEALLDRYRDDERVMHIAGNNFGIEERKFGSHSYGFTRFPQVWGWATWRRAWRHFDVGMSAWPSMRSSDDFNWLPIRRSLRRRQWRRWDDVHSNRIDTWDFQWHFAVMRREGLAAVPRHNLVSNIGFNQYATHTRDKMSDKANLHCRALEFPLTHPGDVHSQPVLDEWFSRKMLGGSRLARLFGRASKLVSGS